MLLSLVFSAFASDQQADACAGEPQSTKEVRHTFDISEIPVRNANYSWAIDADTSPLMGIRLHRSSNPRLDALARQLVNPNPATNLPKGQDVHTGLSRMFLEGSHGTSITDFGLMAPGTVPERFPGGDFTVGGMPASEAAVTIDGVRMIRPEARLPLTRVQ